MGSKGSTSAKVGSLDGYVAELSQDDMDKVCANTVVWKIFSEDLEWASCKLKPKPRPIILGRKAGSDIVVNNKTTSGCHATLDYDENTKRWVFKDVGSSTGSLFFSGSKLLHLPSNMDTPLPISCAFRLGKGFITLVSDRLTMSMILECKEGPLKGSYWKVPTGSRILSCGKKKESTIHLSGMDEASPTEFQVYNYNGWFAISDVSDRVSSDSARDRNGTYLNGKQISRREMNFLWMGAEIKIRYKTDGQLSDAISFVVKCKIK